MLKDALTNYVETGTYNDFLTNRYTQLEQTANSFQFSFSELQGQLQAVGNTLNAYISEQINYITFSEGNIVLSATNSSSKLKISKTKISFIQGSTEVAYISDSSLYITTSTILTQMKIGSFVWQVQSSGNMRLIWAP